MNEVLFQINYWAVFVASGVYWLLGMLWFAVLMGKSWLKEIEKHGIKIKQPTPEAMAVKSVLTWALNFLVAFGIAVINYALGIDTFLSSILVGLILGICFAGAAMAISYVWESRSLKLTFIDIGYPVIGIVLCSIIIALWR